MVDDAKRADELATDESYDVLISALHQALETDLSGLGWPHGSKVTLEATFEKLETLAKIAEG
jgi:hypothetical protein